MRETFVRTQNVMHTAESVRAEMAGIVRMAPEPVVPGEYIGQLIRRAAVRLGLTYGRTKKLWYGEVGVIPAHEADMLREAKRNMIAARYRRLDAELEEVKRMLADLERDA